MLFKPIQIIVAALTALIMGMVEFGFLITGTAEVLLVDQGGVGRLQRAVVASVTTWTKWATMTALSASALTAAYLVVNLTSTWAPLLLFMILGSCVSYLATNRLLAAGSNDYTHMPASNIIGRLRGWALVAMRMATIRSQANWQLMLRDANVASKTLAA